VVLDADWYKDPNETGVCTPNEPDTIGMPTIDIGDILSNTLLCNRTSVAIAIRAITLTFVLTAA
jgi:hypothetical protein